MPSPRCNSTQLKEIWKYFSMDLSHCLMSLQFADASNAFPRPVINVSYRHPGVNTDMTTHNLLVPGQFVKHVD